eukprot:CAMPEP_0176332876 /NCGR_PEP_ID=MMETSP0121_2-20121125/77297_1 /TAXON_ID=160619 /ORGANISM="Kryptoperidinium foliaceum, Strain CCMP 1326" /LENGTH=362 /DNA_ID=CAMNT_0017675777 /DNA_START=42 /DNA_END=1132 /DNA_ORIENTATION=+
MARRCASLAAAALAPRAWERRRREQRAEADHARSLENHFDVHDDDEDDVRDDDDESLTTSLPQRLGSFFVIGDWGWDPGHHGEIESRACQQAVADAMAETARLLGDVKFVVNVGDSFYHDGVSNRTDPQWDSKWRDVYAKELRSVPWYSVYGNHDYLKDPCACTGDLSKCAQVNPNTSDLDYFYMPNTSYYVELEHLKLEVIALDMNYYTWVNQTCPLTPCEEECRDNLKERNDAAFDLFYDRAAKSPADSLVVFSHYPTDYFWGFPDFLDELGGTTRTASTSSAGTATAWTSRARLPSRRTTIGSRAAGAAGAASPGTAQSRASWWARSARTASSRRTPSSSTSTSAASVRDTPPRGAVRV